MLLALVAASPLSAQNTVTIDGIFTDWADEFCKPDTTCNDFPNQGDAKGACIASNWVNPGPATLAFLRLDFDETGLDGANTADGCWLIDVNGNGNADRGLCFSLSGNPLNLNTSQLYTCNDSSATTCAGHIAIVSSVACSRNNNLTTERLVVCTGENPDADTGVECSVPVSELGWIPSPNPPFQLVLLKGCTFASAVPNSNSNDCTTGLIIDPTNGGNTPVELQSFTIE